MPCYAGYLLLRHELGTHQQTCIIIDRHFCPHGIHFNVFLAALSNCNGCDDSNPVHPCKWTSEKHLLRSFTLSLINTVLIQSSWATAYAVQKQTIWLALLHITRQTLWRRMYTLATVVPKTLHTSKPFRHQTKIASPEHSSLHT